MMTSIKYICENLEKLHETEIEQYAVVVQGRTEVTYGFDDDCNIEYCEEHDIPCYNRKSAGGCIVHCQDSISLTMLYSHDIRPTFQAGMILFDFNDFLQSQGINSIVDNNDILVEGKKVASGYTTNLPPDWRWCITGLQISMTQDLDLIRHVCKKPMEKIPGELSKYISLKTVINWLYSWLKDNFNVVETEEK